MGNKNTCTLSESFNLDCSPGVTTGHSFLDDVYLKKGLERHGIIVRDGMVSVFIGTFLPVKFKFNKENTCEVSQLNISTLEIRATFKTVLGDNTRTMKVFM